MNLPEFIAEIETELRSFSDTGLIDRVTVETTVLNKMKQLGVNALEVKEKVLHVKDSTVQLPKDFKALKLALKLKSVGSTIKGDRKDVTESYIYKQRIENPATYNELTQEYITNCDSKLVTETITVNNSALNMHYEPEWLSLVAGVKKDFIDSSCVNLHPSIRNSYPHQISITNRMLNTNFKEGQVYIQYRGHQTDEEGELLIPEFSTGDIYEYLKQCVKIQLVEGWGINDENPKGIMQFYSTWKSEINSLKRAALVEAKYGNLSKGWGKKFKALNKRDFSVFNLPPLNFKR